ncbi:MAG TPA: hypothetical protein VGH37_07445, partial [Candidatus Acidoferrum sp.]
MSSSQIIVINGESITCTVCRGRGRPDATGSTGTQTASGTWSLTADCTVTGSAKLNTTMVPVAIVINGSS